MAYTPTVWATGDVITAEKLNKAEQGIAAAYEIVALTPTYGTPVYGEYNNYVPVEFAETIEVGKLYYFNMSEAPTLGDEYTYSTWSGLYAYMDNPDNNGYRMVLITNNDGVVGYDSETEKWMIPVTSLG